MYEGLLAYTPRYDADERTFTLDIAAGNDRKKSGSYYTPSELIALVLDEALDPLIDEALRTPDPEQALLAFTVVDPACGSGHFVVAAARRIATALADRRAPAKPSPAPPTCAPPPPTSSNAASTASTSTTWPSRSPRSRCGWKPSTPTAHSRSSTPTSGSATRCSAPPRRCCATTSPTPRSSALGDDDKDWTAKLKARNKAEREADADQLTLDFGPETLDVETTPIHQGRPRRRRRHRRHPRAACGPAPTPGARSKPTPTSSPPNSSPTHGAPRSCSPRPGPHDLRPGHHPRHPARPVREPRRGARTPSSR